MRIRAQRQFGDETRIQHGTCVAILYDLGDGEQQYILTAKHVIERDRLVEGASFFVEIDDKWQQCAIVARATDCDLALLRLPGSDRTSGARIAPSERVLSEGSSLGEPVTRHIGSITAFCIDVPAEHGMSGGPVFDATAHVCGILIAISEEHGKRQGVVLSAGTIRKFLNSLKPVVATK